MLASIHVIRLFARKRCFNLGKFGRFDRTRTCFDVKMQRIELVLGNVEVFDGWNFVLFDVSLVHASSGLCVRAGWPFQLSLPISVAQIMSCRLRQSGFLGCQLEGKVYLVGQVPGLRAG